MNDSSGSGTTSACATEAVFSLVWCRTVPETLFAPFGPRVTRKGFGDAYTADIAAEMAFAPWELSDSAWPRFWSNYLRKPQRMRTDLSLDVAWAFLVPLAWNHTRNFEGPDNTDTTFDLWIYPFGIVVIARVHVVGSWTLSELPDALRRLRRSQNYTATSENGETRNRNLDGIASDLANLAANWITPTGITAPSEGVGDPLSITTVLSGTEDASAWAIGQPIVDSCLAGLAGLGPPGVLRQEQLLAANNRSEFAARVCFDGAGHVIWRADVAAEEASGALACLQRNHTEAVAHVAALGAITTWAAEQIAEHIAIAPQLRAIVDTAVFRLSALDQPKRKNDTYRAGILAKRIDPIRDDITLVQKKGLGFGLEGA